MKTLLLAALLITSMIPEWDARSHPFEIKTEEYKAMVVTRQYYNKRLYSLLVVTPESDMASIQICASTRAFESEARCQDAVRRPALPKGLDGKHR